jgi:hypothetical protein
VTLCGGIERRTQRTQRHKEHEEDTNGIHRDGQDQQDSGKASSAINSVGPVRFSSCLRVFVFSSLKGSVEWKITKMSIGGWKIGLRRGASMPAG